MMVDDYSLGVAVLPRGRYQWQLTDAGENYSKFFCQLYFSSPLDNPTTPTTNRLSSPTTTIILVGHHAVLHTSHGASALFLLSGLLSPQARHSRPERRSIAYKSRRWRRHRFHCFPSASLLWTQREGRKVPWYGSQLADAAIEELRDAVSALQESLALLMSLPASSALAAVVDLDVEDAEDDRETQVMSCTASKCPMEYAMASEEMGCTLELMTTDAAPTTISTDPPKLSEPTPQLLSCPSCSVPMCPPLQSTLLGAAHSWVASIYR
ncbi:hypothetical protein IWX47DRAFT_851940 [Phyllosticta citricarpa]